MLTRIELKNFMSHAHTVIEPAAGLTVLVGPNNCGKSAFVAALQILCNNDKSNYVLRHGEKECSVEVETAEGHIIRWTRKTSPSYRINGQLFDRLRGVGLPEELHQSLRLAPVDSGEGSSFDVHFGCQKSPIFLLNEPPSAAAKFFASSSDAIRLVEMQRRHREKHFESQREKARLEAESKQLNAELESLQPAAEIDHRLKASETLHQDLNLATAALLQLESETSRLDEQVTVVAYHRAENQALHSLAPPPRLEPVADVALHISNLASTARQRAYAADQAAALQPLSPPPRWQDTANLASHVAQRQSLQQFIQQIEARRQSLAPLPLPPVLRETAALESCLNRLRETTSLQSSELSRSRLLQPLSSPPLPADERGLSNLVNSLAAALREARRLAASATAASRLQAPAVETNIDPLEQLVIALETLNSQEQSLHSARAQLVAEQAAVAAELRALAAHSVCPTCGAPLDADRLVSHAAHGGPSDG